MIVGAALARRARRRSAPCRRGCRASVMRLAVRARRVRSRRARCGSQSTMRAPIAIRRSTKKSRFSNIFSWISTVPRALRREHERDRREVGREARPRRVVDLRDRAVEVVAGSRAPASAARRSVVPSTRVSHAEPREHQADHAQVVGHDLLDAQLAAGHRRDRDERADLDVVGRRSGGSAGTELRHAVDVEHVRADAARSARPSRSGSGRGPGRAAREAALAMRRRARRRRPRPSRRSRSP